jgi:glycosyltransferase involved in cell wall biosynthesis
VSTQIGSAREYFGEEAWYCHPEDLNSIQDAVVSAINAPSSNALREKILKYYTWDHSAKATLAAYEAVLNSS